MTRKRNYKKERVIYLRLPEEEYQKVVRAASIVDKSINKFCWIHLLAVADRICIEEDDRLLKEGQ